MAGRFDATPTCVGREHRAARKPFARPASAATITRSSFPADIAKREQMRLPTCPHPSFGAKPRRVPLFMSPLRCSNCRPLGAQSVIDDWGPFTCDACNHRQNQADMVKVGWNVQGNRATLLARCIRCESARSIQTLTNACLCSVCRRLLVGEPSGVEHAVYMDRAGRDAHVPWVATACPSHAGLMPSSVSRPSRAVATSRGAVHDAVES